MSHGAPRSRGAVEAALPLVGPADDAVADPRLVSARCNIADPRVRSLLAPCDRERMTVTSVS